VFGKKSHKGWFNFSGIRLNLNDAIISSQKWELKTYEIENRDVFYHKSAVIHQKRRIFPYV
jgi:hypothetical protein